jgi:hypothetical protein
VIIDSQAAKTAFFWSSVQEFTTMQGMTLIVMDDDLARNLIMPLQVHAR